MRFGSDLISLYIWQSLAVSGDMLRCFSYHTENGTHLTTYPTLICILIQVLAFHFGAGKTSGFIIICNNSHQRVRHEHISLYEEKTHEQPSAGVVI